MFEERRRLLITKNANRQIGLELFTNIFINNSTSFTKNMSAYGTVNYDNTNADITLTGGSGSDYMHTAILGSTHDSLHGTWGNKKTEFSNENFVSRSEIFQPIKDSFAVITITFDTQQTKGEYVFRTVLRNSSTNETVVWGSKTISGATNQQVTIALRTDTYPSSYDLFGIFITTQQRYCNATIRNLAIDLM